MKNEVNFSRNVSRSIECVWFSSWFWKEIGIDWYKHVKTENSIFKFRFEKPVLELRNVHISNTLFTCKCLKVVIPYPMTKIPSKLMMVFISLDIISALSPMSSCASKPKNSPNSKMARIKITLPPMNPFKVWLKLLFLMNFIGLGLCTILSDESSVFGLKVYQVKWVLKVKYPKRIKLSLGLTLLQCDLTWCRTH